MYNCLKKISVEVDDMSFQTIVITSEEFCKHMHFSDLFTFSHP